MLTSWELIENLLRTHWEKEENEKSLLHLHSLQTQKIHWGHVEASHGAIGNTLETKGKMRPEFFKITYLAGY